ncbi:MAG: hypothetical protein ACI9W4_000483 [Rhodothermales bacterium]|jgi:uncharacterized protein (TIGR02453 family)
MDDLPPFPGFRPEAFQFLRDLKENNEREWFKARKATFDDELLWPLRCLIADAGRVAPGAGLPIKGDPSKSVFRIYRDIRFSKNKDPYKTHLGAVLSRSGSRKAAGGLYLQVEPGSCFLCAGFWQPDKTLLGALRERIVAQPDQFRDVLGSLGGRELMEYFGKLKRTPRGFEHAQDPEVADFIKHKSFMVETRFKDEAMADSAFTETLIEAAQAMKALLQWGWEVEDEMAAA